MRATWLSASLIVCACVALAPVFAQSPTQAAPPVPAAVQAPVKPAADVPAAPKAMELGDILAWRSMGAMALSNDGAWLAYSGGGNMAIFESSQGRFLGRYWDNWEAYVRNSPKWYTEGVPRLEMADHLKERAGMGKPKDKDADKDNAPAKK